MEIAWMVAHTLKFPAACALAFEPPESERRCLVEQTFRGRRTSDRNGVSPLCAKVYLAALEIRAEQPHVQNKSSMKPPIDPCVLIAELHLEPWFSTAAIESNLMAPTQPVLPALMFLSFSGRNTALDHGD